MAIKRFYILAFSLLGLLSACTAALTAQVEPSPDISANLLGPTAAVDFAALWHIPEAILLEAEDSPRFAEDEFKTDFSQHAVPYSEILSGGPPKDGIPAVDHPKYVSIQEADGWLDPAEPVLVVEVGQESRAYPIQILMWHEIVNDTLNGLPLTITFCPLCNTGIAFERTVLGQVLDFGTTGRLRYSNLILYDRQSESWWQQASGQAITGVLTGYQLNFYPVRIVAWEQYKTAFPRGSVLSRDTGFTRRYGQNPYQGYDDLNNTPFLYAGPATPGGLQPMSRVLTIDLDGEAAAYPYELLEKMGVVNDSLAGQPVVVLWQPDALSALDAGQIAAGRVVGSAAAFERTLSGQTLTFILREAGIFDEETNSAWNVLGQATHGPLNGSSLTVLPAINHFWFSWAAFKPETRIYTGE